MAKGNSKRRKPSAQELRAFRSKVSQLKKAGLVSARVDARKQQATRYMKAKIAKLQPVLAGEMSGVKVSRDILQRYKEGGFQIINGRVLVNKDHDEMARAKKGELIALRKLTPGFPFEKVVMPYRINSMGAFFEEARKSPPDPVLFSSRKNASDYWAFTYYGWNSLMTFEDLGLLAEYLEHYQSIEGAAPEDLTEIFENFILYRTLPSAWAPRSRPGRPETPRRRSTKTIQDRRLELAGRQRMTTAESAAERNARNQRDFKARERERAANNADYAAKMREKKKLEMQRYRARQKAKNGSGFNPT